MKGSTKRVFSILVSIALIIGSLLVFSSLIKPEYEEVVKRRAEVEARISASDEYKNSTKNVEKLLKEFQNIDQFKENISMVLPVDQNFPQAMNQITGLASINKINVESLSIERTAIKPTANADTVKGVGT
ncbi:hypothetical protein HY227_02490, partial [Candidatus Wolfebacteria bacterium]|nr:hypothetical protein [Candidatus Wolfebacteria bacterium]